MAETEHIIVDNDDESERIIHLIMRVTCVSNPEKLNIKC